MSDFNTPMPPPPPGYGESQPQQGAPKPAGLAIASLVTGLVGLLSFCCGLFVVSSIAAIITGVLAQKKIAASNGALTGKGFALTGIITGAVGVVVFILAIVLVATGVIDTNFDFSQTDY